MQNLITGEKKKGRRGGREGNWKGKGGERQGKGTWEKGRELGTGPPIG